MKNELQHLCLNQGVQCKHKLWNKDGQQMLRQLPLKPWAARRREDLLGLLAMLDGRWSRSIGPRKKKRNETKWRFYYKPNLGWEPSRR